MNTQGHRFDSSPSPRLVPSTAGIRVVLWETDQHVRQQLRTAIQRELIFALVGEARDWDHCMRLLEETVPELLIAPPYAVPPQWWSNADAASCFPLVLGVGTTASLMPVQRRVLDTLAIPVGDTALRQALIRAQAEIYTLKAQELSYLLRQYTASSAVSAMYLASITVDHEGQKVHLDTRTIAAVLASANYCRLHTASGVYEIRETMNGLCAKLDPTQFARIHRSVIVNVSRVREIALSHDVPTAVVLHDGMQLPVGPNFRQSLQDLALRQRA
jgi:two-component system LytT family response regulator